MKVFVVESTRGFGLMGLLIRNGSTVGLSSPLAGRELWKKSSSSGLPCFDIMYVMISPSRAGRQPAPWGVDDSFGIALSCEVPRWLCGY